MSVTDRWHKAKTAPGAPVCDEHEKTPTDRHGIGDRWLVRWRDEHGAQRKRSFTKKAAAETFDARMKADADAGVSIDVNTAARLTVEAYWAQWMDSLIQRDGSRRRRTSTFTNHIGPVIGHLSLAQVRASHIRTVLTLAASRLGSAAQRTVHGDMRQMFHAATLDRLIGVSPMDGIKAPKSVPKKYTVPTQAQVHQAASILDARYAAMVYISAGCGLRIGEVLGLELANVDFLRREVTVAQQLVGNPGEPAHLGELKTDTSYRVVDLPSATAIALSEHIKNHPPVEVEIEDRTDPRKPRTRTAKLLFASPGGKPLTQPKFTTIFKPVQQALGWKPGTALHAFRHYFATSLIHAGASVNQVQLALGHSTPTVTLNTYTHEWPDVEETTRTIMDRALGEAPGALREASGTTGD